MRCWRLKNWNRLLTGMLYNQSSPKGTIESVCESLIKILREQPGYLPVTLHASDGDQLVVVVDSSEAGGVFTVGTFITLLSEAVRWYRCDFKPWDSQRTLKGQRLSYKDVRSKESHGELFRIMSQCSGHLFAVSSPSLSKLILSQRHDITNSQSLGEFREWSPKLFEKLLRTGSAVAVATSQFINHPTRWTLLHDNDDLVEPGKREATEIWISSITSAIRRDLTPLKLITKDEIMDTGVKKALLAIPDIAAGGVGSLISASKGTKTVSLRLDSTSGPKIKDQKIGDWMFDRSGSLRKLILTFDESCNGGLVSR